MGRKATGLALFAGFALAAAAAGYALAIRPRLLAWGATVEERYRPYPGDDLVPNPQWSYTHAITIYAPAAAIWPWLVQRGYRRGGWYTCDGLYKLIGADEFVDGHSARRIIPELQGLQAGDSLPLAPGVEMPVAASEPERLLLVHAEGDPSRPGQPPDPALPGYLNISWLWLLEPLTPEITRLIDHLRLDYHANAAAQIMQRLAIDPGAFVLDRKMLLGIKERAEGAQQEG